MNEYSNPYVNPATGERDYPHFSAEELAGMQTLAVGQADDLKYDHDGVRVWLARTGVADGEPYDNKVTVEVTFDGKWHTVAEYAG